MVHLSSFISIPQFCQVTLKKKEKVLDPSSTVSSTRELNDNRQKMHEMFYFCLFPPTSHYGWNCIQETEERTNSKKTCNEDIARTKSTLGLFQPKRKTNFNTRKSKHWEGWPFAGKKGQTSEQICWSKGALQTNTSFWQTSSPYEHKINLQPSMCL